MSDNLIFHPKTEKDINIFLTNPVNALGLIGPKGHGKLTLAVYISKKLINIQPDNPDISTDIMIIKAEGKSITIDQIREIVSFLELKSIGSSTYKRSIIIDDADLMTIQAQNALLKILEEPPVDTVIILNSTNQKTLLPTIYSRVQCINVIAPNKVNLLNHLKASNQLPKGFDKLYAFSGGNIGTFFDLIRSPNDNPATASIILAKSILQMSVFDRLKYLDKIIKNKDQISGLFETLHNILRHKLIIQINNNDSIPSIKRTMDALVITRKTTEDYHKNAHPKLLLTNLFVNL